MIACADVLALLASVALAVMTAVAAEALAAATPGEWPMPRHDRHHTGLQPLPGGTTRPHELLRIDLERVRPGTALVQDLNRDGQPEIVWGVAGGLACADPGGRILWQQSGDAMLSGVADLDSDGRLEIVTPSCRILDAATGRVAWEPNTSLVGGPVGGGWRVMVGKWLRNTRGLQVLTSVDSSSDAVPATSYLLSFEEGVRRGRVVWRHAIFDNANNWHTALAGDLDGDGSAEYALAVRHGLEVVDCETGKLKSKWDQPDYAAVDGNGRKYGSMAYGDLDGDGRPEIVVLADWIVIRTFAVRSRGSVAEPLWSHCYGWQWPPGERMVHYTSRSVADVDGDGRCEVLRSLHDGKQWVLQILDGATGNPRHEEPGLMVQACEDLDGDGVFEVMASHEPGLVPRDFSDLVVARFKGNRWAPIWRRSNCRVEGERGFSGVRYAYPPNAAGRSADTLQPFVLPAPRGANPALLVSTCRKGGVRANALARLQMDGTGRLVLRRLFALDEEQDIRVMGVGQRSRPGGFLAVLSDHEGGIRVVDGRGRQVARWQNLPGVQVPPPTVADVAGEGRAQIITPMANGRVGVYRISRGKAERLWRRPAGHTGYGFTTADFDGDGTPEIACSIPGQPGEHLAVLDAGGRVLWSRNLSLPDRGPTYRCTKQFVGDFDADGRPDILGTANYWHTPGHGNSDRTWAVRGRDGHVLWYNDARDEPAHHYMGVTRLGSAADVNGDGTDDAILNCMTRIVTLHGTTGKLMRLEPMGFHPSVSPVDVDGDGKLEIVQHADGGGPIVCVDAATLRVKWHGDRPVRVHAAFADVNGDGVPEVIVHDGVLHALSGRDGHLLWEFPEVTGASDSCLCDVDGDGKLEALVASGTRIVAVRVSGTPTVVWSMDLGAPCGSPVAADVDGDGLSEVLVACGDGFLRVVE